MRKFLLMSSVIMSTVLVSCITVDQNTSMSDSSYYSNTGNCFSNGRVGYSRDYSYGGRYVTGQNRSC